MKHGHPMRAAMFVFIRWLKKYPSNFKLVTQCHTGQQKAAGSESVFCVCCALYITTLMTTDNGHFLPANFF